MNKKSLVKYAAAGAGILIGVGISKLINKKVEKLPEEKRKETGDAMTNTVVFASIILALLALDKKIDKVVGMCDLNMVMNILNSDSDDETKIKTLKDFAEISPIKVQKVIHKILNEMEAN